MEVVLRQDVDHVGLRGEVVNVARGYARNYLLPRGLAELATPGLKRELERREAIKSRNEAKTTGEAEAIAKRIEAAELKFEVNAGPSGSLFGSVTATNVVDKLWDEQKIRLDRRKLGMQTIKRIGRYTVDAEIFTDVHAQLQILVVPGGRGAAARRARGRRARRRGDRRCACFRSRPRSTLRLRRLRLRRVRPRRRRLSRPHPPRPTPRSRPRSPRFRLQRRPRSPRK